MAPLGAAKLERILRRFLRAPRGDCRHRGNRLPRAGFSAALPLACPGPSARLGARAAAGRPPSDADLPPHRRGLRQRPRPARHRHDGRAALRHVRGRRRLHPDAAPLLHRHPARGRRRLGRQPDRRLLLLGLPRPLRSAGPSTSAWAPCCSPAASSDRRPACRSSRRLRQKGQFELVVSLLYVVMLGTIGGLMLIESVRDAPAAQRSQRGAHHRAAATPGRTGCR